tara:strand:+ start:467 stop:1558 length:1092 start_codon:yes stop_codon:yes gene_type:complete
MALAAFAGTIARFVTGIFLDRGINCANPLKIAALIVIIADIFLFFAQDYGTYLQGQFCLGTSAGIYWPSIETAVALSCKDYPSRKGFSLVRSADALGISIGITLGTFSSSLNFIQFIYLLDVLCMLILLYLLKKISIKQPVFRKEIKSNLLDLIENVKTGKIWHNTWLKNTLPLLIISLFATGVLSLLQSGLPIDLVKGGFRRPPLEETFSGFVITIQLFLLLIFQWPIGKYLSSKSIKSALRLSLACLGFGCFSLAISSLLETGLFLVFIAILSIAIGLTSFLPTASDAVIKIAPLSKRGLAMAMYSQCFGISALISPYVAGKFVEDFGNGFLLWVLMTLICIAIWPLINNLNIINQQSQNE